MNQLNQMAKASESYCSDYGGYFPSWPGWGSKAIGGMYFDPANTNAAHVSHDSGFYTDAKLWNPATPTKGRVSTNAPATYFMYAPDSPIYRFRTIFCGDKIVNSVYDDTAAGRVAPVKGELNMAPVGLGSLVVGGYAGDARVFYCPSVGGSMPLPGGANIPAPLSAAKSLGEMQKAGGFDAQSILHGDWAAVLPNKWGTDGFLGRAVLSDYAYRGNPVFMGWDTEPANNACYLRNTAPHVQTEVGCPAFKTQKLLGGRALIADAFGRNFTNLNPSTYPTYPNLQAIGEGYYGHRDGYNVLFGDWHTSWSGDPQQKMIWWHNSTNGYPDGAGFPLMFLSSGASTAATGIYWCTPTPGFAIQSNYSYDKYSSHAAWQVFDRSAGIDMAEEP